MIFRACGTGRALAMLALVAVYSIGNAQQTTEVVIREYRYQPQEIKIKVGDTVRWINKEKRTSHSILFAAENGLESERIFPDEFWQRRFDKPGRYAYGCGPHPEMTGVVDVSE